MTLALVCRCIASWLTFLSSMNFRTGRRLPKPAVMLQHGAMQALIAGDAEREPRLPNVGKVRGCGHGSDNKTRTTRAIGLAETMPIEPKILFRAAFARAGFLQRERFSHRTVT